MDDEALVTGRSMCFRLQAEEHLMSRYYFHVVNGRDIIDNEGVELPGLEEIRAQALHTAGEILRDEGYQCWNGTEWQMNVTDATGQSVLKLRFSADAHGIAPQEHQEIRLWLSSLSANYVIPETTLYGTGRISRTERS